MTVIATSKIRRRQDQAPPRRATGASRGAQHRLADTEPAPSSHRPDQRSAPGAGAKPAPLRTRRCTAAAVGSCSRRRSRRRSIARIAAAPRPGSAASVPPSRRSPHGRRRDPATPGDRRCLNGGPAKATRLNRAPRGWSSVVRGRLISVALACAAGLPARRRWRDTGSAIPGMEHLHFAAGPVPGHPRREPDPARLQPRPQAQSGRLHGPDGARTSATRCPNGKCCGKVPPVDVIHLHHGVWLSNGAAGEGEGDGYGGGFYPFMAAGEEKTVYEFPRGLRLPGRRQGPVGPELHDPQPDRASRRRSTSTTTSTSSRRPRPPRRASRPCTRSGWTSRTTTSTRCSTSSATAAGNGKFTFPDMAKHPYGRPGPEPAQPLNEFTVDHPGTLSAPPAPASRAACTTPRPDPPGRQASGGAIPGSVPNSVRLFRSYAHYWDKRGPDLVGHGDDRHARQTGARRSRPATCCGSAPPTTPRAPPGMR